MWTRVVLLQIETKWSNQSFPLNWKVFRLIKLSSWANVPRWSSPQLVYNEWDITKDIKTDGKQNDVNPPKWLKERSWTWGWKTDSEGMIIQPDSCAEVTLINFVRFTFQLLYQILIFKCTLCEEGKTFWHFGTN